MLKITKVKVRARAGCSPEIRGHAGLSLSLRSGNCWLSLSSLLFLQRSGWEFAIADEVGSIRTGLAH